MSTLAGAHRGNEIALQKVNELLNMDRFGVVEVVDSNRNQFSRRAGHQLLDGSYNVRLVTREFENTVSSHEIFQAGTPKVSILRGRYDRCNSRKLQFLSETATVHFINHQCQVNQNQCMWSQHRKRSWTLPRYGFAGKRFRDS